MNMEEEELKKVKSMLRAVLISEKNGISASMVQRDYTDIVGESIPWKRLGFQSFEQFVLSIPDVARLERRGGEVIIHGVADESTSHIKALVSKQRSKKVKKPVRRRRGPAPNARFMPRPAGPRPPGPYRRMHPGTPGQHVPRYGVPSFISPPMTNSLTPVTISINNSASPSRMVRVGRNNMFNKAMADANKDSGKLINRPQQQSASYEVPPRFRKKKGGASPPQPKQFQTTPIRRPQNQPATMADSEDHISALSQYLREINQPMQFDTTQVGSGYVSSIKINKNIYGSEDIFRTAKEAEAAASKNAVTQLVVLEKTECPLSPIDWESSGPFRSAVNWADAMSQEESGGSSLPKEQILKIKSRVKEILSNKKNGLWGTRIPHEYKEKYKEDPPSELMELVRSWKDIAKVEPVQNTDRELVYPVTEDPNRAEQQNGNIRPSETQVSCAEKEPKTNSLNNPGVKDLYGLYVDTKDKQQSILKNLEVCRDCLITSEDPVTVYMTNIHNPGFFCVQREDSLIDSISESLQTHCQSCSSPPPSSDLEKGRYCAAIFSGDETWTRAQILQHKDNGTVEVLFIDYGNVEDVKESNIRWLSPDLVKQPAQAINCSLYGIKPKEDSWSSVASNMFAELVQEEPMIALPQTFCDNVVEVVLYLKADANLSINEKLIEASVAIEIKGEDESIHPAELDLPEDKEWDVHVTYISSSTESVMLRLVGDEFSDKLDAYQAKLQQAFRNSEAETPIKEDMTYVAYDDGLYHRVRVISQDDKKVQCYFLDHGDTDELLPGQLHPIDPQINKLLPYQAIEVSLYGLEEVSTNITALEKICDLALGRTCVAEIVEREGLPCVILYDTSGDNDININETILSAIEAEGGGISTPKTASPSPGNSAASTPQRVLSPVPSEVKISSAIGDSTLENKVDKLDSNANPVVQNGKNSIWNNTDISAQKSSSQQLSPSLSQLSINSDTSTNSDISMRSKTSDATNVSQNSQNVNRPILGRSSDVSEVISLSSNDNEIPRPFQIPRVGEYLDVHVNFVHDPSNFVCIPYEQMNRLNQLLLDMMAFYKIPKHPMSKSDIQLGGLYAGHKDGVWYRVKATNFVGTDLVTVYFVDIGEYSVMMLAEIQPLEKQFYSLPLMALSATLGSVVPISGTWYEAAKYKFIELAREKDLIGLVQGYDEKTGVVDLRLIDTSKDSMDVCIDEVLVQLEYATFK